MRELGGKYRDRFEIVLSVLKAIKEEEPAKAMKVMYKSALSWNYMKLMLKQLMDAGLIVMVDDPKTKRKAYYITAEGEVAIKILEAAKEIMRKLG